MSDVVNVFWSAIKMETDTSSRQREKKEHLIWHFFSKAQKEEINKIIQTFNQPKEYIKCASKCAYYTPLIHHAPTTLELLTGNVHKTIIAVNRPAGKTQVLAFVCMLFQPPTQQFLQQHPPPAVPSQQDNAPHHSTKTVQEQQQQPKPLTRLPNCLDANGIQNPPEAPGRSHTASHWTKRLNCQLRAGRHHRTRLEALESCPGSSELF